MKFIQRIHFYAKSLLLTQIIIMLLSFNLMAQEEVNEKEEVVVETAGIEYSRALDYSMFCATGVVVSNILCKFFRA